MKSHIPSTSKYNISSVLDCKYEVRYNLVHVLVENGDICAGVVAILEPRIGNINFKVQHSPIIQWKMKPFVDCEKSIMHHLQVAVMLYFVDIL